VPKAKPTTYDKYDDGSYKMTDIEFFTKDNDGLPIYVTQEGKQGMRMVARYRTYIEENGDRMEGPPGSINRGQLPLLVQAFGGDPSQLPKDELKALVKAEQLIRESKKETTVVVRNGSGWINSVYDMSLPVGDYTFSYSGIPRKDEDGNPILSTTGFGTFLVVGLVVDDPNSPFNGVPENVWVNWETLSILKALMPDNYNLFVGEDIARFTEMLGGKIRGTIENTEKGRPKLNKSTLRAVTDDDVADTTGDPTLGPIEHLYQCIADEHDKEPWRDSEAFDGVGTFSQLGKMWAKTKLAPLCKEHSIPKKFSQMDSTHIHKLLEELGRNDLAKLMGDGDEPW